MLNHTNSRQQKGFTLLELLLVVFILSSLAVVSLNFVDLQDGQQRYDETKRRLETIRAAVLGYPTPVYNGEIRLSGFIVDNGKPPTELNAGGDALEEGQLIKQLNEIPSGWYASAEMEPYVDLGNKTCITGVKIRKGYRGNYLANSLKTEDSLADAWGNSWIITEELTTPAPTPVPDLVEGEFEISSLGQDASVDNAATPNANGINNDIIRSVKLAHYKTSLQGSQIEVENRAGTITLIDTPNGVTGNTLKIAILEFQNGTATNGMVCGTDINEKIWTTTISESITPMDSMLCDADGDGTLDAVCDFEIGSALAFNFSSTNELVAGRHPVVLLKDDGNVDSANFGTDADPEFVVGYIDVYPGSLLPSKVRLFKAG